MIIPIVAAIGDSPTRFAKPRIQRQETMTHPVLNKWNRIAVVNSFFPLIRNSPLRITGSAGGIHAVGPEGILKGEVKP